MGERSSVNYCELYLVDGAILDDVIMAKKIAGDEDYLWSSISKQDKLHYGRDESAYFIDWDDWKIFGYFYSDFCGFINELQELGLRGHVSLCFTDGMDYKISFEDDGVYCIKYGTPKEDENGHWINKEEIYAIDEKYILPKGGL